MTLCADVRKPLPLCANYFSVMLDSLQVQVQCEEGLVMHSVEWALGMLHDGEVEVLGAWPASCDDTGLGRKVFADLKDRGVEAIRFVIGSDPTLSRVDALAAFPRVRVLPSFEGLLRETLLQVSPAHKRAVGAALRRVLAAESLDSANSALDSFAARWEHQYSTLVGLWQRALEDSQALYALSSRHRHLLLLADEMVVSIHERVRRARSRKEPFHSSAEVFLLVEAVLSQVGHRLARRSGTLGFGAGGHLSRRVDARVAASA
jgi:putative transposase